MIFTIKDYEGNFIAQTMTQSIHITDDHKTHGPTASTGQDFGFTDPIDSPPNQFLAVLIQSATPLGQLTNDGAVVHTGSSLPVADGAVYDLNLDAAGATSVRWRTIPQATASLTDLASSLLANGCYDQLDTLQAQFAAN